MIGRAKEVGILKKAMDSKESEFVAVYGRRRIGKTFITSCGLSDNQYRNVADSTIGLEDLFKCM